MSDCRGCFNGCADIISDQCVKYTGDAIDFLGIENGDPLSVVEQKIADYLATVLDGTGISPVIPPEDLCDLISIHLPANPNLVDVLTAIVMGACSLQGIVDNISLDIGILNANYDIGSCLSGVTSSSDTHNIVQAVIYRLCSVYADVTALQVALSSYELKADLNSDIQDYLDSIAIDHYYNKMVPYTVVEYYGALDYPTPGVDGFGPTGIGFGYWEKVYLCNGLNGTPDKRGRIPVGANSMGGNVYASSETDPGVAGNPNYALLDVAGNNNVTLSTAEMPSHNHTAVSTPVDPGHRHLFGAGSALTGFGAYSSYGDFSVVPSDFEVDLIPVTVKGKHYYTKSDGNVDSQASQTTGVTVSTVIASKGSSDSHENRPPVLACYYIMYRP